MSEKRWRRTLLLRESSPILEFLPELMSAAIFFIQMKQRIFRGGDSGRNFGGTLAKLRISMLFWIALFTYLMWLGLKGRRRAAEDENYCFLQPIMAGSFFQNKPPYLWFTTGQACVLENIPRFSLISWTQFVNNVGTVIGDGLYPQIQKIEYI